MPRKKAIEYEKPQSYDIDHATVVITWEKGHRPKMQHLDTVVIVGDHRCGSSAACASPAAELAEFEPGPSREEVLAFQAQREAMPPKRPFTSEDAAREAGFNVAAVDFDNVSRIAESLPAVEQSIVE